jgi:hypothetical protein
LKFELGGRACAGASECHQRNQGRLSGPDRSAHTPGASVSYWTGGTLRQRGIEGIAVGKAPGLTGIDLGHGQSGGSEATLKAAVIGAGGLVCCSARTRKRLPAAYRTACRKHRRCPVLQHHDINGPLTLNIVLSFAQFEREVIGERIRDKFAASCKKGMWMGGSGNGRTSARSGGCKPGPYRRTPCRPPSTCCRRCPAGRSP